jgi:hypothetical protein
VYQSVTAGQSSATLATWYVDDIEQVVDETTAVGVGFSGYEESIMMSKGSLLELAVVASPWFQDPDGNTFSIEADTGGAGQA